MKKSYGNGIARLGSDIETVDSFRTGHDDLDAVLVKDGFGIARGKVIEFSGPESCGKCLTKDSFCITPSGMMTVEEIFTDAGISCKRKCGFVEQEYKLLNIALSKSQVNS